MQVRFRLVFSFMVYFLRAYLFAICGVAIAAFAFVVIFPFSVSRGAICWARQNLWANPTLFCLRIICGISLDESGTENIPDEPCIFACKHQSAWEIFFFSHRFRNLTFVSKREVFQIPLLGFYMKRTGMISLDRSRGLTSLRHLEVAAREGEKYRRERIIIFPEGTRMKPGETRPYLSGVVVLAQETGFPIVPVALNSGKFWPRKKLPKRSGKVSVRFLAPVDGTGLSSRALRQLLQERIEAACTELP